MTKFEVQVCRKRIYLLVREYHTVLIERWHLCDFLTILYSQIPDLSQYNTGNFINEIPKHAYIDNTFYQN